MNMAQELDSNEELIFKTIFLSRLNFTEIEEFQEARETIQMFTAAMCACMVLVRTTAPLCYYVSNLFCAILVKLMRPN